MLQKCYRFSILNMELVLHDKNHDSALWKQCFKYRWSECLQLFFWAPQACLFRMMNLPKIQVEGNQVRETYSEAGTLFGTLGLQKRSWLWQQSMLLRKELFQWRPCQGATAQMTAMWSRREVINLLVCKKSWLGELQETNCKSHAAGINRPVPCLCLKVFM